MITFTPFVDIDIWRFLCYNCLEVSIFMFGMFEQKKYSNSGVLK